MSVTRSGMGSVCRFLDDVAAARRARPRSLSTKPAPAPKWRGARCAHLVGDVGSLEMSNRALCRPLTDLASYVECLIGTLRRERLFGEAHLRVSRNLETAFKFLSREFADRSNDHVFTDMHYSVFKCCLICCLGISFAALAAPEPSHRSKETHLPSSPMAQSAGLVALQTSTAYTGWISHNELLGGSPGDG